jgi:hypothetical protein
MCSGCEGDASLSDFRFEFRDGRDVLVDDRFVNESPKSFGGLQLGTIGRQINEANPIWDFEIGRPMPPCIVEHEPDDAR